MNSKMTTNSQLSRSKPKKTKTTRIGAESQKCRSHGGLSEGGGRGRMGKRHRE